MKKINGKEDWEKKAGERERHIFTTKNILAKEKIPITLNTLLINGIEQHGEFVSNNLKKCLINKGWVMINPILSVLFIGEEYNSFCLWVLVLTKSIESPKEQTYFYFLAFASSSDNNRNSQILELKPFSENDLVRLIDFLNKSYIIFEIHLVNNETVAASNSC